MLSPTIFLAILVSAQRVNATFPLLYFLFFHKHTQQQLSTPHEESKTNFIFLKKLKYKDCQQSIPQLISNRHISQILECDYRIYP